MVSKEVERSQWGGQRARLEWRMARRQAHGASDAQVAMEVVKHVSGGRAPSTSK